MEFYNYEIKTIWLSRVNQRDRHVTMTVSLILLNYQLAAVLSTANAAPRPTAIAIRSVMRKAA